MADKEYLKTKRKKNIFSRELKRCKDEIGDTNANRK